MKNQLWIAGIMVMLIGVAVGETVPEMESRLSRIEKEATTLRAAIAKAKPPMVAATTPATRSGSPTTATAVSVPVERKWKWNNQTISSDEMFSVVKSGMSRNMKFDDLCVLLKNANFSPPNLQSSDEKGDKYMSGCWINRNRGVDGWIIYFTVADDDRVIAFKFVRND